MNMRKNISWSIICLFFISSSALAGGGDNQDTYTMRGKEVGVFQNDGTNWDAIRYPNVFKTFNVAVCGTETTIWTPAAGKKFRMMGYNLSTSAATPATLRDNTAGTTIFLSRSIANNATLLYGISNGILSAAANNVLTIQSTAASDCVGTIWGTEE